MSKNSARAPLLQAKMINKKANEKQKQQLAFEVILFNELCKQFEAKGWAHTKDNPFLSRKTTPFQALSQKNKRVGCEVKRENQTTSFALLSDDLKSYEALAISVKSYNTAFENWKRVSESENEVTLSYSLTVDSAKEIKPILLALNGLDIKEFYIRDPKDAQKLNPAPADKITKIRAEVMTELRKKLEKSRATQKEVEKEKPKSNENKRKPLPRRAKNRV